MLITPLTALAGTADTAISKKQEVGNRMKVVAGTSLVEDIIQDLTDARADVLTLISGASCPGHGDMKASDVVFVSQAQLVIVPAFQRNMPSLKQLLTAAENPKIEVEAIDINDNWMVPQAQIDATRKISDILQKKRPEWSPSIQEKTIARINKIQQAQQQTEAALKNLKGRHVVAAKMQADFLTWAGLSVVATYGQVEEMTPKNIAAVIDRAHGERILGVIDNMQSGTNVGKPLAEALEVPHITLSNFPGSSADTADYFSLLKENIKTLTQLSIGHGQR